MVGGKSKSKDKLVPTTPAQLQEEDEGESDVEDQDDGEGPTVSLHKEVKDLSARKSKTCPLNSTRCSVRWQS